MNTNHNDLLERLFAGLPVSEAPENLNASILRAAAAYEKKRKCRRNILLLCSVSAAVLVLAAGGYYILYYFGIALHWSEWFAEWKFPEMDLPKITFSGLHMPPVSMQPLVLIGPLLILSIVQLWVARKLAAKRRKA